MHVALYDAARILFIYHHVQYMPPHPLKHPSLQVDQLELPVTADLDSHGQCTARNNFSFIG